MSKRLIYIDANILIAAYRGNAEISELAISVLEDPDHDLVVSDPLWLELMPKLLFFKRNDESEFFEAIFASAVFRIGWSIDMTSLARELAVRYGRAAMDAIHAAAAILAGADEFVTGERQTKPLLRVKEIAVRSLQSP